MERIIRVLNKHQVNITLSELPNYISLVLQVPGCQQSCPGCHSKELRDINSGEDFSLEEFKAILNKYRGKLSGVVFLGGEWFSDFIYFLEEAQDNRLKTCLYTGKEELEDTKILKYLDFIKYGPWIQEKGGLDSKTTNQRFINVKTNEKLNKLFYRKEN